MAMSGTGRRRWQCCRTSKRTRDIYCSRASTPPSSSSWATSRTTERIGCTGCFRALRFSRSSANRTRPRRWRAQVRSSPSRRCSNHGWRGGITRSALPNSNAATQPRRWSASSVPGDATTPPAGPSRSSGIPRWSSRHWSRSAVSTTAAALIAEYEKRCPSETHRRLLALIGRYRGLIASLRGEHENAEAGARPLARAAGAGAEPVRARPDADGARDGAPAAPTAW